MDLITLQEYKDFYNIKKPDEDARHQLLISSISAIIQAYLGIGDDGDGGKTVTETIALDYQTNQIFLKHYPVDMILSLEETDRYTWDSTVHVPLAYASQYALDSEDGILTRTYTPGGFANWPIAPGIVTVTYLTGSRWGNLGGGVPADLKLAAIELVNYYKNQEWQSQTVQGVTRNSVKAAKDGDFPPQVQVILDRYR